MHKAGEILGAACAEGSAYDLVPLHVARVILNGRYPDLAQKDEAVRARIGRTGQIRAQDLRELRAAVAQTQNEK